MSNIIEFVQQQQSLFVPAVSDNSVKWESESQFALQAFQANDFLAKTALSNPVSAQNAIINVAAIGITLNPAQKLAYLVPRNKGVCLDISYMGLMHLAMETGSIRWGQAVIVYANDKFKRVGIDRAPLHEVDEFGDRGEPVGVYCVVKTSDGDYLTETMKRSDIEDIRDRSMAWKMHISRGKPCPWSTDALEMWRKTVVKRASKYWPKVERLNNAIEYLNNDSYEGFEKEPVLAHYSESEVKELQKENDDKFTADVNSMIKQISTCQSIEELKPIFGNAYNKTRGHKLQQEVQAAYASKKGELNG